MLEKLWYSTTCSVRPPSALPSRGKRVKQHSVERGDPRIPHHALETYMYLLKSGCCAGLCRLHTGRRCKLCCESSNSRVQCTVLLPEWRVSSNPPEHDCLRVVPVKLVWLLVSPPPGRNFICAPHVSLAQNPCCHCACLAESRCLDAFTAAFSHHESERSGKCYQKSRWYVSTLELQLASLEFCRACRSVPTWHLRLEEGAPERLWRPPRIFETPDVTLSSNDGESKRVPAVRALGLTCRLQMNFLFRRVDTIKMWTRLEFMRVDGHQHATRYGLK